MSLTCFRLEHRMEGREAGHLLQQGGTELGEQEEVSRAGTRLLTPEGSVKIN